MENEFKYFTLDEFACKETGENKIAKDFVHRLDELRERCGFAFVVTSGYRSSQHSKEVNKITRGRHAQGIAADIAATDAQAYVIMKHAFAMGFKGIARGKGFVHIDNRPGAGAVWPY